MESKVLSGDFPAGAKIVPAGFMVQDIEIRWYEGFHLKHESLKGKIARLEILDKNNLPPGLTGGLTPLEGGIIGGSVAKFNGFLAGCLSLSGDKDIVLFICYLRDERHFIAVSDYEMSANLNKI